MKKEEKIKRNEGYGILLKGKLVTGQFHYANKLYYFMIVLIQSGNERFT